jgi:AhpD family alkylhydroperoxidase
MRLRILDQGHDLPTRLTFAVARRVARAEVPEVIKVAAYRHRYFGTPFHVLVQDLMRGPSSWTVGERELFAAFTSSRNQCQFCTTAHQAFAASCTNDDLVAAALAAPAVAPVRPQVAAVLTFLDTLAGHPSGSQPTTSSPLEPPASTIWRSRRPCASAPCSCHQPGHGRGQSRPARRTIFGPRPPDRHGRGLPVAADHPLALPWPLTRRRRTGPGPRLALATVRQSCGT